MLEIKILADKEIASEKFKKFEASELDSIEKQEFSLEAQSRQVGVFFWFLAITWQLTYKFNHFPINSTFTHSFLIKAMNRTISLQLE